MRNQLKGLTENYNGRIMFIYVNVDKCRLGFCTGLWLHLFRIASGGLTCEPFLHADFLAVCLVYAAVVGFVILASTYLAFYGCLYAYMCILSTVNAKLILGTFTGFIMVSGYCIMSRFTVL